MRKADDIYELIERSHPADQPEDWVRYVITLVRRPEIPMTYDLIKAHVANLRRHGQQTHGRRRMTAPSLTKHHPPATVEVDFTTP